MRARRLIDDRSAEALWKKAQASGMSRRKFLYLLAGSGAAAVLAACAAAPGPSPSPTAASSPPPSPSPSPSPSPTRLIDQPTPPQFFNPIGGGNVETRLENMADRAYLTPNSFFFVRNHSASPFIDLAAWRLSIQGDGVASPLTISYDDLLKMPATTVTRYVECAGNGRSFYSSQLNRRPRAGSGTSAPTASPSGPA